MYLSDGSTYRYLRIRAKEGKPYLLFIHGWPSSSYDWRYQIEYFRSKGYGLIVPDLLGYGGTTKPADAVAYRTKRVAENVIEILNCEGIKTVYGISHDLCVLLSSVSRAVQSPLLPRYSLPPFSAQRYCPLSVV